MPIAMSAGACATIKAELVTYLENRATLAVISLQVLRLCRKELQRTRYASMLPPCSGMLATGYDIWRICKNKWPAYRLLALLELCFQLLPSGSQRC